MTPTAMIYKDDDGKWTTEVRGDRTFISAIAKDPKHLVDGSTVGWWRWDTWEEARDFVFGPEWRGGRGLGAVRERAQVLQNRWWREEERRLCRSICMIPDCGCSGGPHR